MPGYKYEALDTLGNKASGVTIGGSPREVRAQLREQGLLPVAILEAAEKSSSFYTLPKFGLSQGDLAGLTRQLASLLQASLPVDQVFTTLQDLTDSKKIRQVLVGVQAAVREGSGVAEAMEHYPHIFPSSFRAVISAGERSGHLAEACDELADHYERNEKLVSKIILSLAYPALVTLFACTASAFMLLYFVPEISRVFARSHQELPLLTVLLIGLSRLIKEGWMFLVGGLFTALVGLYWWMRYDINRARFQNALLRLPAIGWYLRSADNVRLFSTLSTLISSGTPLPNSIEIAAKAARMQPVREALLDALNDVTTGGSLAKALSRRSHVFSPTLIHFVSLGERVGDLGGMIKKGTVVEARRLESKITMFTSLLEPALILAMGCLTLIFALGMLLPILEMNQLVR